MKNKRKIMNKYHQAIASVAFLTLFLTAGLNSGLPGHNRSKAARSGQAKSELILNSFENADYGQWQKALGDSAIGSLVSHADFGHFIQARSAVRSGQYDVALALTQNLESKLKNHLGELYLS
jgi:hypothetical protein